MYQAHGFWTARIACAAFGAFVLTDVSASALTVPFVEDFSGTTSQWFTDSAGAIPPTLIGAGGPDGGSFVSRTFNFLDLQMTDTPIFFRGQNNFDSSGDAFVGDWIAGGVTEVSAWVRHDGSSRLGFFIRLAPTGAGGVIGLSELILPGEWARISFPITSSAFINEGPPGAGFFNGVMSNISNVQIGALPGSMTGVDQVVNFDIDKVRIVPEPASLLLLGGGALLVLRRSARRK